MIFSSGAGTTPGKVVIRPELGRPFPLYGILHTSPVIVVVCLISASKMNPKWLMVRELFCVLRPTAFYEISSFSCAIKCIKWHPICHYLCHIISLILTKYCKQLIFFSSFLYYSNITELNIFKVSINQITRKYFWPVTPLLDQSYHINTFGFELCDTLGDTKSTV